MNQLVDDLTFNVIHNYIDFSHALLLQSNGFVVYVPNIFDLALTSLPNIPLEESVPRIVETVIIPHSLFVKQGKDYFHVPIKEVW